MLPLSNIGTDGPMWNVIIEGISPHLVAGRIMGHHGRDVCRLQVARSEARAVHPKF